MSIAHCSRHSLCFFWHLYFTVVAIYALSFHMYFEFITIVFHQQQQSGWAKKKSAGQIITIASEESLCARNKKKRKLVKSYMHIRHNVSERRTHSTHKWFWWLSPLTVHSKGKQTTNFINCHLLQLHHIIYSHAYRVKLWMVFFVLHALKMSLKVWRFCCVRFFLNWTFCEHILARSSTKKFTLFIQMWWWNICSKSARWSWTLA